MFFDAEPWVFTLCYTIFGGLVLATIIFIPPEWRKPAIAESSPDATL
jgi:hypothetical protein